jgi:hypothetical protein
MNPRIRELAEQAFFDAATSQPSDRMYTFSDHKMQQFAELIVRECIDLALVSSHRKDDMGAIIANNIKKHFGVER